jgi:predicted O-methyltransferase YrrM
MTPEELAFARAARGFMPDDEGQALYRAGLAAASRVGGPLVEIGTYCGKSSLYLGPAARAAGTVVMTIDHHRGSEELQVGWDHHDPDVVDPVTGRMDSLPFARRAVEDAGLERHVILVVGESTAVAAVWPGTAAMVFIDGGHGEKVAWADYRSWSPKVAAGGCLAIHDVFADPSAGGRPPWEMYRAALDSGRFVEDGEHGCGSLRVLWKVGEPA